MKQKELTNIYDDFELKKTLWFQWFIVKYVSVVRVNGKTSTLDPPPLLQTNVIFK